MRPLFLSLLSLAGLCLGVGQVAAADVMPVQIVNASVLGMANRANALSIGFVTSTAGPAGAARDALVRAVGADLAGFGVSDTVATPNLLLERYVTSFANPFGSANGWFAPTAMSQAVALRTLEYGAFPLSRNNYSSALVATISPGQAYSALAINSALATGTMLMELYVPADTVAPVLRNFSARGHIVAGREMVVGLTITGTGQLPLLIRGTGRGLWVVGVTDGVFSPHLTVRDARAGVIATAAANSADPALIEAGASVSAFRQFLPGDDTAVLVNLSAGIYTVGLAGATDGTGLIEVYVLP